MAFKVYAVSAGEYSDYRIESLHSTRELAEQWIEKQRTLGRGTDYHDVEEWSVDEDAEKQPGDSWTTHVNLERENFMSPRHMRTLVAPGQRSEVIRHGTASATVVSFVSADHCQKVAAELLQEERARKAVIGDAR